MYIYVYIFIVKLTYKLNPRKSSYGPKVNMHHFFWAIRPPIKSIKNVLENYYRYASATHRTLSYFNGAWNRQLHYKIALE